MSNLFSTKGIKETTSSNQKYIYGGVYHDVVISNVAAGLSSQKQTPYVVIEMYTAEGGKESAKEFQFYFSENAAEKSMVKIQHIFTKIGKLEDFENIVANDTVSFAAAIKPLIINGHLRMKFTAEQYENTAGEVKDVARIGLPPFAEAIAPGSSNEVVADADTALVYDKNNQWDYKKLAVNPDINSSNNDAPF